MSKTTKEMTFDEFCNWAAGYILLELIEGNFKSSVRMVITQYALWDEQIDKNTEKEQRRRK